MRLSFSESDIDPRTQLNPAVNQAAADHIAAQEAAAGWVDPDKTRVVPAAELAAWRAVATAPAPAGPEKKEEETSETEPKTFLGLSLPQVIGGVLASTTAAILGGQLGVAGTVMGAAMTTGIITVGGALYSHGITKTGSRLGAVTARFRLGGTTPLKNVPDVSAEATQSVGATEAHADGDRREPVVAAGGGRSWRDKFSPIKLLATAAAIFLLAAVVVTGLEALRGESFSGGGQTTVSQIGGERTSGSTRDSDSGSGSTEPRRAATQPAASPTATETQAPTPTSQPSATSDPTPTTAPTTGASTGTEATGGDSTSGNTGSGEASGGASDSTGASGSTEQGAASDASGSLTGE